MRSLLIAVGRKIRREKRVVVWVGLCLSGLE